MKALLTDISSPASARLYADSAIGRCSMPLFVPEAFSPWRGSVHLAVRIGRLGKCIAPKFAMRYIDGVTAVHVMHSEAAGSLAYIADNAIIHGEYIPPMEVGGKISLAVTQGDNSTEIVVNPVDLEIPSLVSELSVLTTFKTGDLIILASPAVPTDIENLKNTYITADINGRQCIKFKVK